jgi:hypothetical protein
LQSAFKEEHGLFLPVFVLFALVVVELFAAAPPAGGKKWKSDKGCEIWIRAAMSNTLLLAFRTSCSLYSHSNAQKPLTLAILNIFGDESFQFATFRRFRCFFLRESGISSCVLFHRLLLLYSSWN